nr:hypothetical protein [Tanacetum cinerariifolium]
MGRTARTRTLSTSKSGWVSTRSPSRWATSAVRPSQSRPLPSCCISISTSVMAAITRLRYWFQPGSMMVGASLARIRQGLQVGIEARDRGKEGRAGNGSWGCFPLLFFRSVCLLLTELLVQEDSGRLPAGVQFHPLDSAAPVASFQLSTVVYPAAGLKLSPTESSLSVELQLSAFPANEWAFRLIKPFLWFVKSWGE